jgi:hypothetical protein
MNWLRQNFSLVAFLIIGLGIGWLIGLSVSPVVSIVISSVTASAAAIIAVVSGVKEKEQESEEGGSRLVSNLKSNIRPWPLAFLIIGIVGGSILGLRVRTNDLLGRTDVKAEIQKWEEVGLKLEDNDIRRLYELEHPTAPLWMGTQVTSGISNTLLAEVMMWENVGLPKQEIAQRLFDIKYSLAPPILEANGEAVAPSPVENEDIQAKAQQGVLFASVEPAECDRLAAFGPNETLRIEMKKSKDPTILFLAYIEDDAEKLREILDEWLCEK